MNNQQCRLIASAIIVAAGGITLSLGLLALATSSFRQGGEVVGTAMLVVGSIMFIVEYIKSLASGKP